MADEKNRDFSGYPAEERKKAEEKDKKDLERIQNGEACHLCGQGGTPLPEPLPDYDKAECEEVYPSDKTLWGRHRIVFGRDRSERSHFSGYGGKGATSAGSIDIVVGSGGPRPKHRQKVGPNFIGDAARISLSQRADIDSYMSLPFGQGTGLLPSVNRSAIGIKADAIRIVGREGVRIYTKGRTPTGIDAGSDEVKETNSRGENLQSNGPERGIHLIAHEQTGTYDVLNPMSDPRTSGYKGTADGVMFTINRLQPMVRGENLLMTLNELVEQIRDITVLVQNFTNSQMDFNKFIMSHTHTSPGYGSMTPPATDLISSYLQEIQDQISNHVMAFGQKNTQLSTWFKSNYLSSTSPMSFLSRYNKTN
jgi:hypothetical protein